MDCNFLRGEQLSTQKMSLHDCLWNMIHVSYSTAHACNFARSTACSSYWQSHRKKDSQRDCQLLHELLPYLGCPFEPDLTRGRLTLKPYIARSHTYSVQHDRERKFQRDIDKRAAATSIATALPAHILFCFPSFLRLVYVRY